MQKRERFDKFTERARKVLSLAHEEAVRLGHTYIGSEHILLGLVRDGDGVGARVLQHLGVELNQAREVVKELAEKEGQQEPGWIGLNPEGKQVIERAMEEARLFNHHYIGTEHIVLALVKFPESMSARALQKLGVGADQIRIETVQMLSQSSQPRRSSFIQRIRGSAEATQQSRDRFDKFDEHARQVLALAQEEAQRFQHNYIGTEHLLLGLVRLGESTAGQVLNRLGVQLQHVRDAIEFIIGRGDRIVLGEIGLTPRAKKVIELAVEEARLLDHHYIGTEHILLGLVREGEGIAAGVLESLGVNLEKVRQVTLQVPGRAEQSAEDESLEEEEGPPVSSAESSTMFRSGPRMEAFPLELLHTFARDYVRGEKQAEPASSPIQDADDLVPPPTREEEYGNRFTLRARRVLVHAHEEAQSQHKEQVGTDHLLLALLREQNGIAFHILRSPGIDSEQLPAILQSLRDQESFREPAGPAGLTIDGQKAIWAAIDEVRLSNQAIIGVEHLLLGLLAGGGIASRVLETIGLTLLRARAEIRRLRGF